MKSKKLGVYEFCAICIILCATLIRFYFISHGWPQTNSDESTMGLMALHITYNGAHPLIFYGQDYMGALEAYLAVPFFLIFGPSVLALRLDLLLIFMLFLSFLYIFTSIIYNKSLALLTIILLSGGPSEVVFRQLLATGGYPEGSLFGILLLVLAYWIILKTDLSTASGRQAWRSYAGYALWGFIAGLAFWNDLLMGPFILCGGLLLLGFTRFRFWWRIIALIGVCSLLGFSPYIINYLTAKPDPNSMHAFTINTQSHTPLHYTNDAGKPTPPPTFGEQIAGALLVGLPVTTAANTFCNLGVSLAWPLTSQMDAHTLQCTIVHGVWGAGLVILWLIATISALFILRKLWPWSRRDQRTYEEHHLAVVHATRLALLASAALTFILFICIPASAVTPWSSSRYLVGLLIAAPAVLSPLWYVTYPLKWGRRWLTPLVAIVRYGWFVYVAVALSISTVNISTLLPGAQAGNQQHQALIQNLLQRKIIHIYSDYWTCDRIIFESREKIICAAVTDQLGYGFNRYPPYAKIVINDPNASYAFVASDKLVSTFAEKAGQIPDRYQRFALNGYIIYQPINNNSAHTSH